MCHLLDSTTRILCGKIFFFSIIYKWNWISNLGISNFETPIKKKLNRLLDNAVFNSYCILIIICLQRNTTTTKLIWSIYSTLNASIIQFDYFPDHFIVPVLLFKPEKLSTIAYFLVVLLPVKAQKPL